MGWLVPFCYNIKNVVVCLDQKKNERHQGANDVSYRTLLFFFFTNCFILLILSQALQVVPGHYRTCVPLRHWLLNALCLLLWKTCGI